MMTTNLGRRAREGDDVAGERLESIDGLRKEIDTLDRLIEKFVSMSKGLEEEQQWPISCLPKYAIVEMQSQRDRDVTHLQADREECVERLKALLRKRESGPAAEEELQ
jgi:hypothetical protein